jgi:formamidopyrimidine-DNA glycosylase
MPELPEVQTIVNDLNAEGICGHTIRGVQVYWPKTVVDMVPVDFVGRIRGRTILRIYRRAKYIVFELDDRLHLIVHLRMTGRFILKRRQARPNEHIHVSLALDDHREIWFHDTRKFGRFYLVNDPTQILGGLGPEPLDDDFTAAALSGHLRGRKRQLKPLLLDQTFLSGLGNIYVDEALWSARLHPLRLAADLSVKEITALHRAIRQVLRQGLQNCGTTLGRGDNNFYSIGANGGRNKDSLKVFRRTGEPCPRCKRPIERVVVAQRSTHICRDCQRLI